MLRSPLITFLFHLYLLQVCLIVLCILWCSSIHTRSQLSSHNEIYVVLYMKDPKKLFWVSSSYLTMSMALLCLHCVFCKWPYMMIIIKQHISAPLMIKYEVKSVNTLMHILSSKSSSSLTVTMKSDRVLGAG